MMNEPVDIRDQARQRSTQLRNDVDMTIARKSAIIVGGAIGFLIIVKLGFLRYAKA
jgi:hypothetical protein